MIFLAPTNKAVDVLCRKLLAKGIEKPRVNTVHKAIYKLSKEYKERQDTLNQLFKKLEVDRTNLDLLNEIKRLQDLPFDDAVNISSGDIVIVDECSMVSAEMFQRLLNTKGRFLFVGDPFQLPPVDGTAIFQTMQPNAMLTEITRQALDNPIIRLSMQIRNGEFIQFPNIASGNYSVFQRNYRDVEDSWLLYADKILAGWNENRHFINKRVRQIKGYMSMWPLAGESLICRFNQANSEETGMVSGTECECVEDSYFLHTYLTVKLRFRGKEFKSEIFKEPFLQNNTPKNHRSYPIPTHIRECLQLEYAYAQTVHTAQGSEWDTVVVIDDWSKKSDNYRNWLYTGITRAKTNLLVVSNMRL